MQEALVLKVELLKSLRQQRFLSQEDLFNAYQQRSLRVSLATIKRAETGKKSELPHSKGIIRFLCSAGFVSGNARIS